MNIVMTLVMVLQVLAALGVIGLVLIQHGKGADMGAAFGSGASGSLFGATGSANFLSRATGVLAAIFFITTLALSFASHKREVGGGGSSVMDRAPAPVAPAGTPPATGSKGDVPAPMGQANGKSTPAPGAAPASSGQPAPATGSAATAAPAAPGNAPAGASVTGQAGASAPNPQGGEIPK